MSLISLIKAKSWMDLKTVSVQHSKWRRRLLTRLVKNRKEGRVYLSTIMRSCHSLNLSSSHKAQDTTRISLLVSFQLKIQIILKQMRVQRRSRIQITSRQPQIWLRARIRQFLNLQKRCRHLREPVLWRTHRQQPFWPQPRSWRPNLSKSRQTQRPPAMPEPPVI